jgi:hypothetical protein
MRAPLASARLNWLFMLPWPSLPPACISTETPAARKASMARMALASTLALGMTA